jgi:tetratricopeptide (TPR) repeat protein
MRTPPQPLRAIGVVLLAVSLSASLAGCEVFSGAEDGSTSGEAATGQELYDQGEFGAAIEELEATLDDDPADVDARRTLGLAYAATGNLEAAIEQYVIIIEQEPDDHVSHYRLALWERQVGDADMAATHLEAAVAIEDSDPSYLDELARTYMQLGREQRAAEAWGALLESEGLDDEGRKTILVLRAEAFIAAGMPGEARAAYEAAIEVDPSDASLVERLEALPAE